MTMPTIEKQTFEEEVQISYFVKGKGKASRIGSGRLLDISNVGLCMEISPIGSELFMESGGNLFLLNRNIEIQIFCRSYSNNISVEGNVRWIKREDDLGKTEHEDGIFVGVIFSCTEGDQKRYIAEFVDLYRNDTIHCGECGVPVSVDSALCYKCGSRHVRKRAFLRDIINTIFSGSKSIREK